jgi:hypothetical protein
MTLLLRMEKEWLLEKNKEKKYKPFDPDLYEGLKKYNFKRKRDVKELEILLNKLNENKFLFWKDLDTNCIADLIFFDPDNGFGKTHKHLT